MDLLLYLIAHGVMTRELVGVSDVFRSFPVGVVNRNGNLLLFGTMLQ